jgi:hypothetical protein
MIETASRQKIPTVKRMNSEWSFEMSFDKPDYERA